MCKLLRQYLALYVICSLPESERVSSSGSTFALYGICSMPESKRVSSSGSTFALYVLCIPHGSRLLKRSTIFDRILWLVLAHSCRMDVGVGAGVSPNRNLEASVLPEAWMIFPNQFAPYFSISSSNSGNNLCTQVNRSCSFSAGFPWAGHRSSNPSFPVVLSWVAQDLMENRSMLQWASTSACRWQVDRPREIQDPGLAFQWMAKLLGLAGEDHLYLLKSAVGYELCPQRLAEIGSDLDASFRRCFVETDCDHRFTSWFAFSTRAMMLRDCQKSSAES
ncbi:hypothetical protein F2Q69_00007474 [Brassica cretica]|uniref:Uncharacterized protein n=1 Tax=Brassica cretica TaxID=69181 RepID=A0A8S9P2C9_BRACR|nr:hypothetical protein F2Q69_00007474 [Brassica cretica]